VKNADWRDGGQDAALACLDVNLSDIAGGFLGPGNWRPQRKTITDLCAKAESKESAETSEQQPDPHHCGRAGWNDH